MAKFWPFKGVGGGLSGHFLKLGSVERAFQYEVSAFYGMKIGQRLAKWRTDKDSRVFPKFGFL